MNRCLACNATYASADDSCPACGVSPKIVDGFTSFAADLAHASPGFKDVYFADLAGLEANNFWFQSRNKLILWAIERFSGRFDSLLEIGCGTGFVLSGIASAYPDADLTGSEVFTEGLRFAATRLPSARFIQMDARNIPFVDEFVSIGAFDVLEHIEEDEVVLAEVHAALKSRGTLLLTVPQHPWLWSSVDDYACHVRRYTSSDLNAKIQRAGFEILRSSSFVSCLLPVLLVARLKKNRPLERSEATAELRIPSALNFLFGIMMRLDLALIRWGLDLPFGGSRLIVARKLDC